MTPTPNDSTTWGPVAALLLTRLDCPKLLLNGGVPDLTSPENAGVLLNRIQSLRPSSQLLVNYLPEWGGSGGYKYDGWSILVWVGSPRRGWSA